MKKISLALEESECDTLIRGIDALGFTGVYSLVTANNREASFITILAVYESLLCIRNKVSEARDA